MTIINHLSSIIFAKCSCSAGRICSFCIQLMVSVIAVLFGALIAWQPRKTIDLQIAFYRPFNWKIEPISMEKETRTTRLMGLTLVIIGIVSFFLAYIIH
jgi:hypothetical protein